MSFRWGIASAGLITHDFAISLKSLKYNIQAVAAQDLSRAEAFANKFNIPKAHGSYENLAKDANVDVVYIGCLTSDHYRVTKLMLENGKHVLCEKTFCQTSNEARECIELARSKKLFLMEAIWSRFFPAMHALRKELEAGTIGEPRVLQAEFCIKKSHVDRLNKKTMGGGALYDVGVYVIQLALFVFNEFPKKISAGGFMLPGHEVDDTSSIILEFSNHRIAHLLTSLSFANDNSAKVVGTDGIMRLGPKFWCPTVLTVNGKEQNFELPPIQNTDEKCNYFNSEGLQYEAKSFQEALERGDIENEFMPHAHTQMIIDIIEAVQKQLSP